jgi:hypothetical protein
MQGKDRKSSVTNNGLHPLPKEKDLDVKERP